MILWVGCEAEKYEKRGFGIRALGHSVVQVCVFYPPKCLNALLSSNYLYPVKADYLIVGQGIAGSVMALTLEQRGKSVAIVNDASLSSSSRIAAGIYNPFNFRRSGPTWEAVNASSAVRKFYENAERITGEKFHEVQPITRIFGSQREREEWEIYLKNSDGTFAEKMVDAVPGLRLRTPFGCGILAGGGVVYTGKFVATAHKYFSNRGYYLSEKFDHAQLSVNENAVNYADRVEASHIIFCEGHCATNNPYFDTRTIAPTKGEVLHVRIPGLNLDHVVNGQVYLVPLGNEIYACGATFNPGRNDEGLTAAGKVELMTKLMATTDLPYEVVGHYAGVRPAGRDRKPVVGRSRDHRNLSIFNGFGSKAVLMSPFLAQMLADHLENNAELPPEVNVARFKVY